MKSLTRLLSRARYAFLRWRVRHIREEIAFLARAIAIEMDEKRRALAHAEGLLRRHASGSKS
ncbi:MAG: hypothetical protein LBU45_02235 [Azoarcus sp.]|jgi:hypothetical protein|nr:hypothetical protein [Azoarcus sp.]